ncbi:MAG: hypothetical protein J1F64_09245 [Oscillospiraceae bacterium]|nr:hypothetical protein [Oscillospiraceae bacterium]
MSERVAEFLSGRIAQNIVSLMTGLGFFGISLKFINDFTRAGGGFLGFVFFPAIFCGAALVNIKLIRKNNEENRPGAVLGILLIDIMTFISGILFLLEFLINHLHL